MSVTCESPSDGVWAKWPRPLLVSPLLLLLLLHRTLTGGVVLCCEWANDRPTRCWLKSIGNRTGKHERTHPSPISPDLRSRPTPSYSRRLVSRRRRLLSFFRSFVNKFSSSNWCKKYAEKKRRRRRYFVFSQCREREKDATQCSV